MSKRKTAADLCMDCDHTSTGSVCEGCLTAAMAQEYERGQRAMRGAAARKVRGQAVLHTMTEGLALHRAADLVLSLPTKPAPEPAPGCPPHDPVFHDGDANSWCARCGHFPMPLDGARSLGPRFPPDPTRERGGEE